MYLSEVRLPKHLLTSRGKYSKSKTKASLAEQVIVQKVSPQRAGVLTISTPGLHQSGLALEAPSEHGKEQEANHTDVAIEKYCRVANLMRRYLTEKLN